MRGLRKTLLFISILAIMLVSSQSTVFAAEINSTELSTGCNLSPGESKVLTFFIRNDDTVLHSYSLTSEGSANNYELYFSSNEVATKKVDIPSGSIVQVNLNIKLRSASVNADKLIVKAVRDDGKENIINLSLIINKDYALSVRSMLDKIDVLSGKSAEFTFSVTNNGSKDLNNIKVKPELPYKWFTSKNAETVMNLKSGETGTITTTVDIPNSQASGNFIAKFTAVSDEISSSQISVPVTVKTSSAIGYWMIGILVLIAVFTLIQFKRHGRR